MKATRNPSPKKSVSNTPRSAVNGRDQKEPVETRRHHPRTESTEIETLMLQEAEDAVARIGAEVKCEEDEQAVPGFTIHTFATKSQKHLENTRIHPSPSMSIEKGKIETENPLLEGDKEVIAVIEVIAEVSAVHRRNLNNAINAIRIENKESADTTMNRQLASMKIDHTLLKEEEVLTEAGVRTENMIQRSMTLTEVVVRTEKTIQTEDVALTEAVVRTENMIQREYMVEREVTVAREDSASVETEAVKEDMTSVETAVKEDMASVETAAREDMASVETAALAAREDMASVETVAPKEDLASVETVAERETSEAV